MEFEWNPEMECWEAIDIDVGQLSLKAQMMDNIISEPVSSVELCISILLISLAILQFFSPLIHS